MSQTRVYTYAIPGDLEFISKPTHSAASVAGTLDLIIQAMRRDLEEYPDHPLAPLVATVLCRAEAARRKLLAGGDLGGAVAELERIKNLTTILQLRAVQPDAERGRKTLQGARAGHKATHGTKEEKARRWDELQRAVEEKLRANPHLSLKRAQELIVKELGPRPGAKLATFRRRTFDPRA